MDLRIVGAEPTDAERAAVDAVVGPPASRWDGGVRDGGDGRDGRVARGGLAAAARRDLLLPALHGVQSRVGWVSRGALNYICRRLSVPPAEAWGVVTFYHRFATDPRPPVVAHVCDDIACRVRGAEELCRGLAETLGPAWTPHGAGGNGGGGDRDTGRAVAWRRSPCLGQCERAPAVLVERAGEAFRAEVLAPAGDAAAVAAALGDAAGTGTGAGAGDDDPEARLAALRRSVPQAGSPGLRLLARVGTVDPTSLDAWRAAGGGRALLRAVELGPEKVIAEVVASKLVGRGGAAFPTGRKWEAVSRAAARPHHLVCNADESEPGTFKDRLLIEGDPFALIEAMTICAFATGCETGWVYLRGEYPLAAERLAGAIAAARAAGLLGPDVAGAGFAFDLEIRRGADAYICGEETALFNSIEGKRGEPRSKPPFPVEVGLFGKPTVVNNVETLACVPGIVLAGGEEWAKNGTAGSTGTKLFCVSGCVERPGLYEVPFGRTLGELLAEAGGVRGGGEPAAVLVGGAAGVFVGPDALAMPLTFEGTRAAGATLGSGVVMAFDGGVDLAAVLLRIAEFFRHESCGQCVPCRVGTVRQEELLHRLHTGRTNGSAGDELALLAELGQAMRDASICGLGQTASAAIESAVARLGVFGSPPHSPNPSPTLKGGEGRPRPHSPGS